MRTSSGLAARFLEYDGSRAYTRGRPSTLHYVNRYFTSVAAAQDSEGSNHTILLRLSIISNMHLNRSPPSNPRYSRRTLPAAQRERRCITSPNRVSCIVSLWGRGTCSLALCSFIHRGQNYSLSVATAALAHTSHKLQDKGPRTSNVVVRRADQAILIEEYALA